MTSRPLGLAILAALIACSGQSAIAQTNAGSQSPAADQPFKLAQVATFNFPWRIAFLPDGRMLITEKPGKLWIATQAGAKTEVTGVPTVAFQGQEGLLGVYVSPT